MLRYIYLGGLLLSGCADIPSQSQIGEAKPICVSAPTLTMSNRTNCEQIIALILNGIDRNLGGKGPVSSAQANLRSISPYGPTVQGFKGISPGRTSGDVSLKGDADTVMYFLQILDATSQLQNRTPAKAEVIDVAMGGSQRNESAAVTRDRYLAPVRGRVP